MKSKTAFLIIASCSLLASTAFAQEQWCTDNPTICIASETFTYTSGQYTTTSDDGNSAYYVSPSTKPGKLNKPSTGLTGALSFDADVTGYPSPCCSLTDVAVVDTDSTILSKLPNRNPTAVPRFIRSKAGVFDSSANYNGAEFTFGFSPMNLSTGANGSAVKRMSMRWYVYYSSDYDFAFQKNGNGTSCDIGDANCCTNGKIAHVNAGGWGQSPMITLQSNDGVTNIYSFTNSTIGGGSGNWVYPTHGTFEGFFGAPRTSGSTYGGVGTAALKGKWYRFELVVRNPISTDAQSNGFQMIFYAKNITDDTSEVEDITFGSGGSCTDCMATGGPNFTWNSGIYNTANIDQLHSEYFRAGRQAAGSGCGGVVGFLYMAVGAWSTDAGQRIGPASEIEGGGTSTPNRLIIFLRQWAWIAVGLSAIICMWGLNDSRTKGPAGVGRSWLSACRNWLGTKSSGRLADRKTT